MIGKRYYITFIVLTILSNGLFYNIANSSIISNPILLVKFNFWICQLHDVLLAFAFFYLIQRPKQEALSIACVIGLYQFYILITDIIFSIYDIDRIMFLVYIENILFLLLVLFQSSKKYIFKSDKISRTTVCLIFYKPQTFRQYINSVLGLSFASSGVIIGNNKYILEYGKSTVQKKKLVEEQVKKHYLIIDTKVPCTKVTHVIPELLKQKARQPGTLYLRFNCLRSLKPVLNLLGKKWKHHGEIFPGDYLRKRIQ